MGPAYFKAAKSEAEGKQPLRHLNGTNFVMGDGHAKYFKCGDNPTRNASSGGWGNSSSDAKYWKPKGTN